MNKHLVYCLASLSLASFLAVGNIGCRTTKAAPKVERQVVPVDPPKLVRTWKATLDLRGDKVRELYTTDEYLFVLTNDNYSYVFDRASGTRVHVSKINGRVRPPVVLKDQIVYPTDSTLEVFSRNGRFERSVNIGNTIRTGAVTAAGRVVVGVDQDGRGRALFVNVATPGNDIAPILTMGALTAKPAVRGGLTFVGAEDGRVYAIAENLTGAWALPGGAFETDGSIVADLATDPGTSANVYVASTDSKLYALNATTGQLRWQYYAGGQLTKAPVATADTVYLPVPGQGLVAIDKTGSDSIRKAKWNKPDATRLLADDASYAYVLGSGNRIYGVDKKTGNVKFISERDDLRIFATNNKDAVVYAATPNGEIIAAVPVLKPGTMGEIVMIENAKQSVVAIAR